VTIFGELNLKEDKGYDARKWRMTGFFLFSGNDLNNVEG